jgi:hypothetical protein
MKAGTLGIPWLHFGAMTTIASARSSISDKGINKGIK